jgi:hypothetical protein
MTPLLERIDVSWSRWFKMFFTKLFHLWIEKSQAAFEACGDWERWRGCTMVRGSTGSTRIRPRSPCPYRTSVTSPGTKIECVGESKLVDEIIHKLLHQLIVIANALRLCVPCLRGA